jgi:hypothetical protein
LQSNQDSRFFQPCSLRTAFLRRQRFPFVSQVVRHAICTVSAMHTDPGFTPQPLCSALL